ncbi:MAG: PEP-CTERM sorting domain-containing protein [Planctomycetota bacterium]
MRQLIASCAGLALAGVGVMGAQAATITVEALDLRSTGVFGSADFVAGTINAGPGAPTDITVTVNNLDLDGDTTANDSVTFTVVYTAGADNQRLFNQGADTGFGNVTDLTVSVTGVTGTTTDLGQAIVFDGFTGAAAGAGSGGALDSTVDINGTTIDLISASTGAFQFITAGTDFAPTATVLFDNSVNNAGGSIVARNFDLQFSAIPEPGSFALLGLGGLAMLARRRK